MQEDGCQRCSRVLDTVRKNSSLTWFRGPENRRVKGIFCRDCLNAIQTNACPFLKKDNFVVQFEWKRPALAMLPLPSALASLVVEYCFDPGTEVCFEDISPTSARELQNHLWRAERATTIDEEARRKCLASSGRISQKVLGGMASVVSRAALRTLVATRLV
jgi:hypothetical protein